MINPETRPLEEVGRTSMLRGSSGARGTESISDRDRNTRRDWAGTVGFSKSAAASIPWLTIAHKIPRKQLQSYVVNHAVDDAIRVWIYPRGESVLIMQRAILCILLDILCQTSLIFRYSNFISTLKTHDTIDVCNPDKSVSSVGKHKILRNGFQGRDHQTLHLPRMPV